MTRTIDELFQTPYWVIDPLPRQVPRDSAGQYFVVERYYLEKPRLDRIKRKHLNIVLKLNCYRDISLEDEAIPNPSPERIAEEMRKRYLCLRVDDALILSEPDDTTMTVFNPDESLLDLLRDIVPSEGLFIWQPPDIP